MGLISEEGRWSRGKENSMPFMLSLFEGQPNGRGEDATREGWEFQQKDGKKNPRKHAFSIPHLNDTEKNNMMSTCQVRKADRLNIETLYKP